MTNEQTSIMTSSKPDKDPNALKIASFRTKEGVWAEFCQKAESIGLTATDVIKAAMEQFIAGEYTPTIGKLSARHDSHADSVLTRDEIIDIVNTAISTTSLCNDKHTDSVLTRDDAEELTRASIGVALESIRESVSKLKADTQSQFEAMRDELRAINDRAVDVPAAIAAIPRKETPNTDTNTNRKSWGEFFKMVGIEALTATETQKKENIDIAIKQVDEGVRAAKEQELGDWVLENRQGRGFIRLEKPSA